MNQEGYPMNQQIYPMNQQISPMNQQRSPMNQEGYPMNQGNFFYGDSQLHQLAKNKINNPEMEIIDLDGPTFNMNNLQAESNR